MQATVFSLAADAPAPHRSLIDVEVGTEAQAADGPDVSAAVADPDDAGTPPVEDEDLRLLGTVILDDGREADLPLAALTGSSLRHLRVGQRLSVELDPDRPDERGERRVTRARIVGIGVGERIR